MMCCLGCAFHPQVWAIVINNFSFHYAFYVIMNWLPTFFNRCRCVLPCEHLHVEDWCMPYVCMHCVVLNLALVTPCLASYHMHLTHGWLAAVPLWLGQAALSRSVLVALINVSCMVPCPSKAVVWGPSIKQLVTVSPRSCLSPSLQTEYG